MSTILVFKTNIKTKDDLLVVNDMLNSHQGIHEWNIDTEDIDCVLRIVSSHIDANDIISLINQSGYKCQELE